MNSYKRQGIDSVYLVFFGDRDTGGLDRQIMV